MVHNTHWTPRGALTAFNVVAEARSHSDWRFNIGSVLGKPINVNGGDLARMLGIADEVSEPLEPLALPQGRKTLLSGGSHPTFLETMDRPGPTIMIIGNSFYSFLFPSDAPAACRPCRLAIPLLVCFRLEMDRSISP